MISARTAEENLARIRSLMERSTLYRTVSVPAAAWGGFLSVGAWGLDRWCLNVRYPGTDRFFLPLWLSVLVLTIAGNFFFLARESRQTGSPMFSSGFWTAGRSLFPSFFCAGFVSVCLFLSMGENAVELFPFVWVFFYGLGLLATQHFAPRSIIILGWLFLLTTLILPLFSKADYFSSREATVNGPYDLMALTFGGYHLGYALIVYLLERKDWPGKEGAADGL